MKRKASILGPELPIFLLAAAIFVVIALHLLVAPGPSTLDTAAFTWLQSHLSPGLTEAMSIITVLGDPRWIFPLSLIIAVRFLRTRQILWFIRVLLIVPGGLLLNECFKLVIQRERPDLSETVRGFSFPSSHTVAATLIYGFLAVYVIYTERTIYVRLITIVSASILILLVAVSRVYLQVHYATDVIAGVAAGLVWLTLAVAYPIHSLRD